MLLICGEMILWFLTILAGDILNQWHILSGDRIPSPILGTHPNETLILLDLLHEFGPKLAVDCHKAGEKLVRLLYVFIICYHFLSFFASFLANFATDSTWGVFAVIMGWIGVHGYNQGEIPHISLRSFLGDMSYKVMPQLCLSVCRFTPQTSSLYHIYIYIFIINPSEILWDICALNQLGERTGASTCRQTQIWLLLT